MKITMKSFFILTTLLINLSLSAKNIKGTVYDAFMCYTMVDTVVLFGVLRLQGTLRINYQRLEENPTTIDLKVLNYDRSDYSLNAVGLHQGKQVISLKSRGGRGKADINLMSFAGTEDVEFNNEDVLCYFGKFED